MDILIISDRDIKLEIIETFKEKLHGILLEKGHDIKNIEIGKNDLKDCIGCFSCWVKTPGECILRDSMSEINRRYINSDLVIYFTPIIFGGYSSNIKRVLDRRIPNILPFFQNVNGETHHQLRYEKYPEQVTIGYSNDITEEEKSTFIDLVRANEVNSHRANLEVSIVSSEENVDELLNNLILKIG